MYVNGVHDYSFLPRTTWSGGNMTGFGNLYFITSITGNISMFLLYDNEHTQTQIQQQFNIIRNRYGV